MGKRVILLLLVTILVFGLASCQRSKPLPAAQPTATAEEAPAAGDEAGDAKAAPTATTKPAAEPTDTPKVVEPTEPPAPTEAPAAAPEPTVTPTATVADEGEEKVVWVLPVLLGPPSGYSGHVVDLLWSWDPGLSEGERYQLNISPDTKGATPGPYGLYDQPSARLTTANLAPGKYLWSVSVVKVVDGVPTETVATVQEPVGFELQRLSVVRGQAVPLDFGDAPASFYNTLLVDDGARHYVGDLYLGELIDGEADGLPSLAALGDDSARDDDEDGVIFDTLIEQCATTSITVVASGEGKLDAWLDWNADGYFDGVNELMLDSVAVVTGENALSFVVPCEAVDTATTYMRFRLSSDGDLAPCGLAEDGEVEDYVVAILEGEATPTPTITRYKSPYPTRTRTPYMTSTPMPKPTATPDDPYNPPPPTDDPEPTEPYIPPQYTATPAPPTATPVPPTAEPTEEPYIPPDPTAVPTQDPGDPTPVPPTAVPTQDPAYP